MTEIRSLATELQQQQQARASDQRKGRNTTDSGIESAGSGDGDGGSKQDKWQKKLLEQRQRYYDNVEQLQACMLNRQLLTCQCQNQPEQIYTNCATQTVQLKTKKKQTKINVIDCDT